MKRHRSHRPEDSVWKQIHEQKRARRHARSHAPEAGEPQDLGFGSVVTQESVVRFLNRDGSFNVRRRGLGILSSLSVYHSLLTMPWGQFLAMVTGGYILANLFFACCYLLCGSGAIAGPQIVDHDGGFLRAFFFSVQTFATIGYGHICPASLAANLLVTFESLGGLLGFALATGLVFARFSRPTARIIFSQNAVIMPYRGITAFGFRIANQRSNELIELETSVIFSRFEPVADGQRVRRFYSLSLERSTVAVFPLSWTVVHPIDEESPLFELTEQDLRESDAEFIILLKGFDETFSQTVHTRSSYKFDEVVWEAKFVSMFDGTVGAGPITVDVGKLHEYEHKPLPRRQKAHIEAQLEEVEDGENGELT